MSLDEILERIEYHMRHENYDAAEQWRDHLNDMIRWQRVASVARHGCKGTPCVRHPQAVPA